MGKKSEQNFRQVEQNERRGGTTPFPLDVNHRRKILIGCEEYNIQSARSLNLRKKVFLGKMHFDYEEIQLKIENCIFTAILHKHASFHIFCPSFELLCFACRRIAMFYGG